jgi:fibro-slime domain-containing protein
MKKTILCIAVIFLCWGVAANVSAALQGFYYNHDNTHPDFISGPTGLQTGLVADSLTGGLPTLTAKGNTFITNFDWWDPKYFSFDAMATDYDFENSFLPTGWSPMPDDQALFAVHWTGGIRVPTGTSFALDFDFLSDDDLWVFIDDELIGDLGGVHEVEQTKFSVNLAEGNHPIDIFFAQRDEIGFNPGTFRSVAALSDLSSGGSGLKATITVTQQVPEPSTMLLITTSLVGFAAFRKKFR